MKYCLLTKEQLEALSDDFAKFLASQQVDAKEWEEIKKQKPQVAQEELELFSDLVWEEVLSKIKYIEHISPQELNLFNCGATGMHRLVVKSSKSDFNFYDETNYQWFLKNLNHPSLSYFQAQKKYRDSRNTELFEIIKKGGEIGKGYLYNTILNLLK